MSSRRRNLRKRPVDDDSEDETVVVVQKKPKRTTKEIIPKPNDSVFAVQGNRSVQTESDQGATRHLETETEFDRDARQSRSFQSP